jgi:hypothetical protein
MTERPCRPIAVPMVLLCLAAAPLAAQTPAPAMNAEQGWSAVGQCAAVANERARHACLDDVLRRAGLLNPQAEAIEKRRQFGLEEDRPAVAATPSKAAPAAPSQAAPPAAPAAPERLETRIATIVVAPDHKVVLTTADGAAWKQSDSDTIPRLPQAGDVVRIRKASLGSYLCELPSHHTFRCVRLK